MSVISVTGLGYGDEGKGHAVAYLATQMPEALIVRYTGGPQAAHNVVTEDGIWHCFSQFGSGMFTPGTRTHLSSQMIVKLSNLEREAEALQSKGVPDIWERLTISPGCVILDPYHAMLGQIRELTRDSPFGTVGMGIRDAIKCPIKLRIGDIANAGFPFAVRELRYSLIEEAQKLVVERGDKGQELITNCLEGYRLDDMTAYHSFFDNRWRCIASDAAAMGKADNIILEGSQGTLLDPRYGFYPYITRGQVTTDMVDSILTTAGLPPDVTNLGVTRTYSTRHGYGPFVAEDNSLRLAEKHNIDSGWQGRFRVGWLDLVALRYAISVNRIDALVVSHWDALSDLPHRRACCAYEYRGQEDLDDWFIHLGPHIFSIKRPDKSPVDRALRASMLADCIPVYQDMEIATALANLNREIRMYLVGPKTRDVVEI